MAEREMVRVHVDDGTDRGQDYKFERKDAEKFLGYTPNASIVGEDAPAEDESGAKAQAPAENKAVDAPAAKK